MDSTSRGFGRHWAAFIIVMVLSFAVLGYYGLEIYRQAPPIPDRVISASGDVLFTGEQIRDGQNVWQSLGGQQLGSIWGHGAYVAPDWSADRLHREATWLLDHWAGAEAGLLFDQLGVEQQALLLARLKSEMRTNTYDAATRTLTLSPARVAAVAAASGHYEALFSANPALAELREKYAMPANVLPDAERRKDLNAFFFWTSWACAANRPGAAISYTSNWPPEPLIDNSPTPTAILWSALSVVIMLAGIGALAWYYAMAGRHEEAATPPEEDPLAALTPTPSMRATEKYFWTVAALLLAQIGLGILTAHYGVEGTALFGLPLAKFVPYVITRTWHVQIGLFWIATAWLAAGLFAAPAVTGHEAKGQRIGVNVLFAALILVVVGSLAGEWFGVMQRFGLAANFWFGHQGYEYIDLGRFWQILLFGGLALWLVLMLRALWPALSKPGEQRSLLVLFAIASASIVLFYGAGLMWGQRTHISVVEYWRWWVVHLWVEGFFEVFATVVVAFLFNRLGLIRTATATAASIFTTTIYLTGGILGTFHHLYFSGTPQIIIALGASFSALEIVPLVLVGFEAYGNLSLLKARPWVANYKWPIYFFMAVAFWNLVGAGLFGFLINTPVALFYMQSLNTTSVHGHAALFGVYGMLGIGLILFCLRGFQKEPAKGGRLLWIAFWGMNVGLMLQLLMSMFPVGMIQTWASITQGLWYARSPEVLYSATVIVFKWLRAPGDALFGLGAAALAVHVVMVAVESRSSSQR